MYIYIYYTKTARAIRDMALQEDTLVNFLR